MKITSTPLAGTAAPICETQRGAELPEQGVSAGAQRSGTLRSWRGREALSELQQRLIHICPRTHYRLSLVFDFTQLWSSSPAAALLSSASLAHLCVYYPVPKSFLMAFLLVCPPA